MSSVNPKKVGQPGRSSHSFDMSPSAPLSPLSPRRIGLKTRMFSLCLGVVLLCGGGLWLRYGTIQGVPTPIVLKFLMDKQSLDAYFSGEKRVLHDRLQSMGVEEEIKAYYRDQYPDEVELDWFIHQLLYERTGYVGQSYKLGSQDQLILKTPKDRAFPRWLVLARQAGVIRDNRRDNGVEFVMLNDGTYVTYYSLSDIYTLKVLRQLIRQQKNNP